MRYLLAILIFSITLNLFGQDLKKLEEEILEAETEDINLVRKLAVRIYSIDPYNETATKCLVDSYNYTENIDSIPVLFAKLKSINPNCAIPYLLSANYQYEELTLTDTLMLEELKIAVKLDSNNFEALDLLGRAYYFLFNNNHTYHYALQCRNMLLKATKIGKFSLSFLKYPILQTSHFLKDFDFISEFEKIEIEPITDILNIPERYAMYFPLMHFYELDSNWISNYDLYITFESGMKSHILRLYSEHLLKLKEPLVFNQTDRTIYRFLWLRHYDNPVSIRIEKNENSYNLYWKQTNGQGIYGAGDLIVNDSTKLTKEHWEIFNSLLQKADFWNLPENSNKIGIHGSQWIFEGFENGKYHFIDWWHPKDSDIGECGIFLIELTNLEMGCDDIY